MKRGLNVLFDALWGSSGKGKISAALADRYGVPHVSSSNFPNAGHTVRLPDRDPLVFKSLPAAAAVHGRHHDITCWISGNSGVTERLVEEWAMCGRPKLYMNERVAVVREWHQQDERERLRGIASTMQGSAAALIHKMWRTGPIDPQDFWDGVELLSGRQFRDQINDVVSSTCCLHEVSQGALLSINHGSHYPQCTFRDAFPQAAFQDLCVPPQRVGEIYGVVRSYPIRVGNVVEDDGTIAGYSGDFAPGAEELTWRQVGERAGMPDDEIAALAERERTTVTKRIRRVATMPWADLYSVIRCSGATALILTFAEYIDWEVRAARLWGELPKRVVEFVDQLEKSGVPVVALSNGPMHDQIIWRR